MNPPEIRLDWNTGRIAIETELAPAKRWFIFDARLGGGHYAPGTRAPDDVDDWHPYTAPDPPEGEA